MIIPEEVICKTCERVFCCSECREKHELKEHTMIDHYGNIERISDIFCPICQKKPFILHATIQSELLIHITENHLPLNCQKCSRLYTKVEDLLEFSKCIQNNVPCMLDITKTSSLQIKTEPTQPEPKSLASSVSTQTSPIQIPDINDSHLTPISMINLRWKAKSKITEFNSDSVSSIKNISSINNSSLRKSTGIEMPPSKGKLVRSTSTPLQAEIFAKPKEQAFNVSGGHVSSIYNTASDPESPPLAAPAGTPSKRSIETFKRYQKPKERGKMYKAVTPLRQVMSKSIQKAFAEHGIATGTRGVVLNRKKMFDSIDTSEEISEKSIESYPLDLRLSPALRRTQSEIIDRRTHLEFLSTLAKQPQALRREILLSSTKKTTESIVITSTSRTTESLDANKQKDNLSTSSVYQTHRSVEIITSTSTELSKVNIKQNEVVLETNVSQSTCGIPPITPRIPTSGVLVNKKSIKFETPVIVQKCQLKNKSPDEQFFTPSSTPVRRSKRCKELENESSCLDSLPTSFYSMDEHDKIESFGSHYTDVATDDEVFVEDTKTEEDKNNLWSMVAAVIRLPSLNGGITNPKSKNDIAFNSKSTSLIRRCASFAGSLVRQKPIVQELGQPLKRKRTYTTDSQTFKGNCADFDSSCSESKRFRIQGRKPIQRMRCNY